MAGIGAQLAQRYQREAAIKFTRAVDRTTSRLDQTVPVKTGKLKRSRRVKITTTGTRFSALVEYTQPYGQYLDEGVRPHAIVARRASVLRFMGRDGNVVYRRKVWHPGTNKRRGWFSRPMSPTDWRLTLRQVFGR